MSILSLFRPHKYTFTNPDIFKYKDTEQPIVIPPMEIYVSFENRDSWKNIIYKYIFTDKPLYVYVGQRLYNYKITNNYTLRSHNINVMSMYLDVIPKGTVISIDNIMGPLYDNIYAKEDRANDFVRHIATYDSKLRVLYTRPLYNRIYNGTYFSNTEFTIYIDRIYLYTTDNYSYSLSIIKDHNAYMSMSVIRPIPYFTSYNLYDILSYVKKYSHNYIFSGFEDTYIY